MICCHHLLNMFVCFRVSKELQDPPDRKDHLDLL